MEALNTLLINPFLHLTQTQGYYNERLSVVRVPAEVGHFSLHHSVQTGSGAHPASYTMGTSGSFSGGKAAGA
jgi:hypothetical protein